METRADLLNLLESVGFEIDDLEDTARIKEDLDIDSTELVEIAAAIQKRMALPIIDTELRKLKTFGDLVAFVEARALETQLVGRA